MKISVNDQLLFELSDHHKKVLADAIPAAELEADLKRRLQWVLMHKYEQCVKKMRQEWEPKLKKEGATAICCDDTQFCDQVMARPDYKDRAAREKDALQ